MKKTQGNDISNRGYEGGKSDLDFQEMQRVGRFRFYLASFCGWVAKKLRENASQRR